MTIYQCNKYTRLYFRIIDRRKSLPIDGYGENHHIVPRALGGSNLPDNLVKLTAREHFICHRLLVKMLLGSAKAKMVSAAYMMIKKHTIGNLKLNKPSNRITSKSYAILREEYSKVAAENARNQSRKPHTAEWKAKMSMLNKGRDLGPAHAAHTIAVHTGRKRSDETRAKIKQKRDAQIMPLKEWHLLKPDGTLIKTLRLKEFCQANKLGLSKLRETMVTKRPVDNGYSAGWMIVGFEKLTKQST